MGESGGKRPARRASLCDQESLLIYSSGALPGQPCRQPCDMIGAQEERISSWLKNKRAEMAAGDRKGGREGDFETCSFWVSTTHLPRPSLLSFMKVARSPFSPIKGKRERRTAARTQVPCFPTAKPQGTPWEVRGS